MLQQRRRQRLQQPEQSHPGVRCRGTHSRTHPHLLIVPTSVPAGSILACIRG